jgi:hypothetical protein
MSDDKEKIPTKDEAKGMAWWNHMTDDQRTDALNDAIQAGYPKPSPYNAWIVYKANNETY